jgi:hypothetical protein
MNDPLPAIELEEKVQVIEKPKEITFKLTEQEQENFFKSFLSDEPYTETLPLFKGKATATFKTLSLDENDIIFRQIEYDQARGIAKSDDSYLVKVIQYRLAGCLVSIDKDPFCKDITMESHPSDKDKGTTYLTERLKVMQKWPTFKLGAITEAFNTFEAKVRQLTKESFAEPF